MTDHYTQTFSGLEAAATKQMPDLRQPQTEKAAGAHGKPIADAISACPPTLPQEGDLPALSQANLDGM
jgi:hypothetical protein